MRRSSVVRVGVEALTMGVYDSVKTLSPLSVCLSVSLSLCLCLSLFLCGSVSHSLSLSLSLSLFLCVSLCLTLSLCLSLSVCFSVSVSLSPPLFLSLCFSLCLSLSLSLSLFLSLSLSPPPRSFLPSPLAHRLSLRFIFRFVSALVMESAGWIHLYGIMWKRQRGWVPLQRSALSRLLIAISRSTRITIGLV